MNDRPCDILMIGELGLYPFDQGFKVHGSQMARALSQRGQQVRIATIEPLRNDAPNWLKEISIAWPTAQPADEARLLTGWSGAGAVSGAMQKLRYKLADHQGIDLQKFSGVMRLIEQCQPRVVIGLGQHTPMMLRSIGKQFPDVQTIWYAADELVSFQLSCLKREGWRGLRKRLYDAGIYALLENAFARGLDGAIGVSPADTRLLKWIAGPKRAVTIRNGVDLDFFRPMTMPRQTTSNSVVFWGRMDFEPNVDAMVWFAHHVWPQLYGSCFGSTLRIVGKHPTPAVQQLDQLPGVTVVGEVEDIRVEAQQAAVVVLPMRCGGGIKNKLLEAAAMGLPMVVSPRAMRGLAFPKGEKPMHLCQSTNDWVESIRRVWNDVPYRHELGRKARLWVEHEHHWLQAANRLITFSGQALSVQKTTPTSTSQRRAA